MTLLLVFAGADIKSWFSFCVWNLFSLWFAVKWMLLDRIWSWRCSACCQKHLKRHQRAKKRGKKITSAVNPGCEYWNRSCALTALHHSWCKWTEGDREREIKPSNRHFSLSKTKNKSLSLSRMPDVAQSDGSTVQHVQLANAAPAVGHISAC